MFPKRQGYKYLLSSTAELLANQMTFPPFSEVIKKSRGPLESNVVSKKVMCVAKKVMWAAKKVMWGAKKVTCSGR